MGEVIGIRDETGEGEFQIWYTITGEERRVRIDPDKQELFSRQDILKKRPMACPFLREREPGTLICTVHDTRPDLCRQYSCFRILILDAGGARLGRVLDASRYFTTTDHELRLLWDRKIAATDIPDETLWEEHVDRILSAAGYQVVR
jgi:hypothetical protein